MESLGVDESISSVEGSHARTSHRLEQCGGSQVLGQDSGTKWDGSFAKYDPDGQSWKTWQGSLLGGLETYSEAWPRSGMARNGMAYQLPPSALLTRGTGYSLLPTPTVKGDYNKKGLSAASGDGLITAVLNLLPTPNAGDYKAGYSDAPDRQQSSLPRSVARALGLVSGKRGKLNPEKVGWMMGYPVGWLKLPAGGWATPSSPKSSSGSVEGS